MTAIAIHLNRPERAWFNAAGLLIALTVLLLGAEPRSSFLHAAPAQARPNEPLQVDGTLAGGGVDFKELVLLYRGPGQDYVEAKMELQYGDLYRGTVPAARLTPPGIEYYVEGRAKGGERVALFMSARKPARVIVLPPGDEPDEAPTGRKPRERFPKAEKFEKEPEPADAAPEPEPPPPKKEPPPKREPEDKKPRPKERAEQTDEPPPQPPRPRSKSTALDEELAVYNAEYPAGFVVQLDEATRRSPRTWMVITAAQMRAAGARHVYEVLDLVPGVSVSRDVQGFYRAAIRGVRDEANILYLYDGHPMNAFWDGRALASLPIDDLERIEVLRGPGDASQPAGNFTAAVNLVPNRRDGVRAGFQLGLNSVYSAPPVNPQAPPAPGRNVDQRGSVQGHLAAAKAFDFGLSLALDADVLKDNGYYKPIVADGLKLATPAGYTLDRRTLVNVGAAAGFQSKALGKLALKARVIDEARTPLVGQFDVTAEPGALKWQAVFIDGSFSKQMTKDVGFALNAWLTQQASDRTFHQTPKGFPSSMFEAEGLVEEERVGERTLGLQAVVDFVLPLQNHLHGGVRGEYATLYDYAYFTNFAGDRTRQQPLDVIDPLENGTGLAAHRLSVGLFLMDEWRPVPRITVQAGARLELAQLPTGSATSGAVDGASLAVGLSPRIGVAFAPLDNLVLKAGYARGFRAPTVMELALDLPVTSNNQGRVIGNPSLTPAYLDEVEASLEYLFGLGEARARVRGGGFYDKFTSPIAAVDTSGNLYPVKNRPDGMQGYGLELEARLEVGSRAGAWVNFSWMRVEDLGTVTTAYLLTETPQLRVNAGLTIPLGPYLAADVFATVHGERRNDARSVLELLRRYRLPAYALVGLQVRTEAILEHFEVSFSVHNLFDVDYADDAPRPDRVTGGVPREGLSGMLGARVFF